MSTIAVSTIPRTALRALPPSLRAVQVTAVITLLVAALPMLATLLLWFPVGGLVVGFFGRFWQQIFKSLKGDKVKEGLAMASAAGAATVLLGVVGVIWGCLSALHDTHLHDSLVAIFVILVMNLVVNMPVMVPGALLARSAAKAYSKMPPEAKDSPRGWRGVGFAALYFTLVAVPCVYLVVYAQTVGAKP